MRILPVLLFCMLFSGTVFAEEVKTETQVPAPAQTVPPKPQTSAVMSNHCDETQVKSLAGDALISITKGEWGDASLKGFNVTLDTTKMDFGALTKKLLDAGCL